MEIDQGGRKPSPEQTELSLLKRTLGRVLRRSPYVMAAGLTFLLNTLPTETSAVGNPKCYSFRAEYLLAEKADGTPDPKYNAVNFHPMLTGGTPDTRVSLFFYTGQGEANGETGWTLLKDNLQNGGGILWSYRQYGLEPGPQTLGWVVKDFGNTTDSPKTNADCMAHLSLP